MCRFAAFVCLTFCFINKNIRINTFLFEKGLSKTFPLHSLFLFEEGVFEKGLPFLFACCFLFVLVRFPLRFTRRPSAKLSQGFDCHARAGPACRKWSPAKVGQEPPKASPRGEQIDAMRELLGSSQQKPLCLGCPIYITQARHLLVACARSFRVS